MYTEHAGGKQVVMPIILFQAFFSRW